jgi:hypothetical protein
VQRRLNDDDVRRPIAFLLNEAAQSAPIRDQSVTFTLRALGNYCTVGRDCGSAYLRCNSPYRSQAAQELYEKMVKPGDKSTLDAWRKEVTNEHQEPLKQVWAWMCDHKDQLEIEAVVQRLRQWPVVIVTRYENNALRPHAGLGPVERYDAVGIQVLRRQGEGWVPR